MQRGVRKVLREVKKEEGERVFAEGPVCIACGKRTEGRKEGGFVSLVCSAERCRQERVRELCEILDLKEDYSRRSQTSQVLKRITHQFRVQYLRWQKEKDQQKKKKDKYSFYKKMAYLLELLLLIRDRPKNRAKIDFYEIFDEIMMPEEMYSQIRAANRRIFNIKTKAA